MNQLTKGVTRVIPIMDRPGKNPMLSLWSAIAHETFNLMRSNSQLNRKFQVGYGIFQPGLSQILLFSWDDTYRPGFENRPIVQYLILCFSIIFRLFISLMHLKEC